MKVKNLLLAGLAVAAMTACSNNDEIIDNGVQTPTEEAEMRINFTFDNAPLSRGTEVTDKDKEGNKLTDAGDTFEWKAATITIVLDYNLGNQPKRIVKSELTLIGEGPDADKVTSYQTANFTVDAGYNVKIYAFINPTEEFNNSLANANLEQLAISKNALGLPENGIDYLTAEGQIANPNNFFMSGTTTKDNINPGVENKVSISVSRVTAKLQETTESTTFSLTSSELSNKDAITVGLINHSYSNLSSNSYALPNTEKSLTNDFLQPYVAKGETAKDYRWISKTEDNKGITYCLENYGNDNPTRVHYKAQIYFDNEAIDNDFYIRTRYVGDQVVKTAYKNWQALQNDYDNQFDNNKNTDDSYLKSIGVKRYKSGKCYYEANILHAGKGQSIIRNNWYKLSVSKIGDLGYADPVQDPDEKETSLVITAEIQPWEVQINDIEL